MATSKATTHKSATAAAPVASGAPTPGSVSDSSGPRSASTISRPGSSSRRPPLPPGRPPPQGVTTVPTRATKVGARSVTKSRANPSAKTSAKAGDKTATNPCDNTGAKADDKTTAKTGAKAGDPSAAKQSVKTAVEPSATAAAETTAKAGAGTSAAQSAVESAGKKPVGVSAGDALSTAGKEAPPAVTAQPPSGGPSARRGRSSFGLAADALRRSTRSGKRTAVPKPAAVLQTKRPAAREPTASAPPALKRSRRLVDREQRSSAAQKQASATMSPLEEPLSTTAAPVMQLDAVANRAECTLFSELVVPVATGRLIKERRKLSSRWIDADMTAVELSSVLEPSVCYPYNDRYPLVDRRRAAAVHLDSIVGSIVVWSLNCLTLR